MNDATFSIYLQEAVSLGAHDGKQDAITWDHNTFATVYGMDAAKLAQTILEGIENCDPMVLDTLPLLDLSGQWADMPTEDEYLAQIGMEKDEGTPEERDEVISSYRDAYDEAAQIGAEEACLWYLSDEYREQHS